MAVQAQYHSNIILFNRNGQEGHEFSTGVFLDQSHVFFNNGSNNNNNVNHVNYNSCNANNINNQRKREIEVAAGAAIATPINPFSLQTQPPQLVDLSQLHQPHVVSTGLQLSSGDQRQSQNNSYPQQHLSLLSNSSAFLSTVSDNLGTQIKRQSEELDQILQAQGEELQRALAEKRQRHYRALLGIAEESVEERLREKEAEIEKAKRRNTELEARVAQVSVEAQVWQAKATAQEATAVSLQSQLQQAIMSGGSALAQDSRRGDDGVEGQAEDAESAYVDPHRVVAPEPVCKACRTQAASVLLLPCRHLCLCTDCDTVAQACPLCLTFRHSSIEVFLP